MDEGPIQKVFLLSPFKNVNFTLMPIRFDAMMDHTIIGLETAVLILVALIPLFKMTLHKRIIRLKVIHIIHACDVTLPLFVLLTVWAYIGSFIKLSVEIQLFFYLIHVIPS